MKRQLQIQAEGLSGNLHKMWPDVRDSAWIGGEREGWERVPYWLDGFIPLAYLLENEEMIATSKKYIDAIISYQKPDGWICPCADEERKNYDPWAILLITKVLTVYYDCAKDERIPAVVKRVLENFYELLKSGEIRLFEWGCFRWFEGLIAIEFTYSRYSEQWLLDLARILKEQGAKYSDFIDQWKRPINRWTLETHIVNLTMMLKAEAVWCRLFVDEYTDEGERLREILDKYNGTVYESFTGDECLSGVSPIQGTELCAIVEQMYSYEHLYAYTGDAKWAERLEVLGFNALPATISDDMWTHQYVQMSNQIECSEFPGRSLFRTNNSQAHIFGLEPHYGCCTANFNQGWPKFALAAFMHKDDIVVNAVPVASELKTDKFTITLDTNYPFENTFRYAIDAKEAFKLKLRVPSYVKEVSFSSIDCSMADGYVTVDVPCGRTEFNIGFEVAPKLTERPNGLHAVRYGSLIFSLPIKYSKEKFEYERRGVERKFPYCDYHYKRDGEWEYGFADSEFKVNFKGIGETPFSSTEPPVTVSTNVCRINWGLEDGFEAVCAKLPESRERLGDAEEKEFYPYGCAKLRMTELPMTE